jgi:hypothetical protein
MATLFFATPSSVIPTILAHLSLNVTLGIGGVQLSSSIFWWALASMFLLIAVWRLRAPDPKALAVQSVV